MCCKQRTDNAGSGMQHESPTHTGAQVVGQVVEAIVPHRNLNICVARAVHILP